MKQPTLAEYKEQLKESQSRLKVLNRRGTQALSRYDIEIAYGGNAEEALRTAKWLLGNQIQYYTRLITEMKKEPTQLVLL
jgi:hypothetical protein